ncbi:hypothetical protein KKB64_01075 [Patescibacteria group bacterium]|nr:hypothetical protein [Patescibacteria group bacterium]MBU1472367.1 hypothetical protein [Patescibacteria group bacterium]MBU2459896.1 hypothetical protein [Patescibacteria group bacterium]MBU2544735.1 hypothetical protein [Patescibacteria group bacterium]
MTSDKLHQFLSLLGFSPDEITLYLTLAQKGMLTTLELSRTTGIGRTQVYRLIENLKAKGAAEEVIDEHRRLAKAVEAGELLRLIKEKVHQSQQLQELFPQVQQLLQARVGENQADTKVLFYRGKQGLRQLIWHTLRAHHEVVGYTYRSIEEYVGSDFMLDWRDSFVRKGLVLRDIYSEEYLTSRRQVPWPVGFPKTNFRSRFISQKLLRVNLQMDIYNDVVAQYNWHEGEVFGVEIYNRKIADFHRQLFEIVWKSGKPTK